MNQTRICWNLKTCASNIVGNTHARLVGTQARVTDMGKVVSPDCTRLARRVHRIKEGMGNSSRLSTLIPVEIVTLWLC